MAIGNFHEISSATAYPSCGMVSPVFVSVSCNRPERFFTRLQNVWPCKRACLVMKSLGVWSPTCVRSVLHDCI